MTDVVGPSHMYAVCLSGSLFVCLSGIRTTTGKKVDVCRGSFGYVVHDGWAFMRTSKVFANSPHRNLLLSSQIMEEIERCPCVQS